MAYTEQNNNPDDFPESIEPLQKNEYPHTESIPATLVPEVLDATPTALFKCLYEMPQKLPIKYTKALTQNCILGLHQARLKEFEGYLPFQKLAKFHCPLIRC